VPTPILNAAKVFETKLPTANMPSRTVGEINLSVDGQSYVFRMSRRDFVRLGRRIMALSRANQHFDEIDE
jgi:hypothetical protein